MKRFLRRALNRGLARSWSRWLEMLDELAVLAKFARRALSRSTVKAWGRWCEYLDEREHSRRLMRKLLHNGVQRAWNQWAEVHAELRRLRKFGARLAKQSSVRAFEQWCDVTAQQRRLQRFLRRWKSSGVGRAFETWVEMREHRRRATALLKKVMARWRHRLLDITFDGWAALVEDEVNRRQEMMRSAVNRMRNRLVTECFASWATVVGEEGRRMEIMRPFINLIVNRTLTLHFNGWRDVIAREMGLLTKYAAKIAHTLLAKTFDAWASDVHASREKDAQKRKLAAEAVMRMSQKCLVQTFQAWHQWLVDARAAMEAAATRWASAGAMAAFEKWAEYIAERRRYVELVTKVYSRYSNQLMTKVYLAWSATTVHEKEARAKLALETAAMMSGKSEILLQIFFAAWLEETRARQERRAELAHKMYARYQHQALTKCYLAWAAITEHEAAARRALYEKALAFWSGRLEIYLRLYWDAFVAAIAARKDEREEAARSAVQRMRHGTLHIAFSQWAQLVEDAKLERLNQARRESASSVSPEMAAQLQQLAAEVEKLRAEQTSRDAAAESLAAARLASIEKQLSKTATMLQRSERLLAPLPAAAVDAAAYAMMRSEVEQLSSQLASTNHKMLEMNLAKAGRAELLDMRGAVQRFLFGAEAPRMPVPMPPPPPPPPPPRLPIEPPLEADAFAPAAAPPPSPAPDNLPRSASPRLQSRPSAVDPYQQPRPPAGQRALGARPSTARPTRPGLAQGVAVSTGGDASLLRRPQSARVSGVVAAYSGASKDFAEMLGVKPPAPAAAAPPAAAPPAHAAFVEVTDLTELFAEKGAAQRRQVGARQAGRPQSARATGGRGPRSGGGANRFPVVGARQVAEP